MPRLYRRENSEINIENCENNYRGDKKSLPPPKKKLNFKTCKTNTINSLNEVESFLRNFNQFKKYIKLYKILK